MEIRKIWNGKPDYIRCSLDTKLVPFLYFNNYLDVLV